MESPRDAGPVLNHRPVIELPAPCAGAMLPGVDLCPRDAELVVFGPVIQADGRAAAAWVFVCRKHARAAREMLAASTPDPASIDAMSIDMFVQAEQLGILERSGLDAPLLRRAG